MKKDKASSMMRKTKWSPEEDKLLISAAKCLGTKKWSAISAIVKTRTGKQCRERWLAHLSPQLNKKEWETSEDALLLELHKCYGNKWAQIAQFIPGRAPSAIKNRWNRILRRMNNLSLPIPSPSLSNDSSNNSAEAEKSDQQDANLNQDQYFSIEQEDLLQNDWWEELDAGHLFVENIVPFSAF